MHLADASWPDVPVLPVVLVPLGSTEQHGPHLPFATDAVIAAEVAGQAAALLSEIPGMEIVVVPAMPYGASGEHQDFPGTISIGHDALRIFLIELIRSASTWAGQLVLVNGHGGNLPTVKAVVRQMRHEGHSVSAVACAMESGSDAHAGRDETSVLLHIDAGAVDMTSAAPGNTEPLSVILPTLMQAGVRAASANGVLGDPRGASAAEGAAAFDQLVQAVVREVLGD